MEKLKKEFDVIVEKYIQAFGEKQDIQCNEWVSGDVGSIIECSEMFFNFDDIRYDIDNNITKEIIIEWYWYVAELPQGIYINY